MVEVQVHEVELLEVQVVVHEVKEQERGVRETHKAREVEVHEMPVIDQEVLEVHEM